MVHLDQIISQRSIHTNKMWKRNQWVFLNIVHFSSISEILTNVSSNEILLGNKTKFTSIQTIISYYNEWKDAKETVRPQWVLIVAELFNIAVNDSDAKNLLVSTWCSL